MHLFRSLLAVGIGLSASAGVVPALEERQTACSAYSRPGLQVRVDVHYVADLENSHHQYTRHW